MFLFKGYPVVFKLFIRKEKPFEGVVTSSLDLHWIPADISGVKRDGPLEDP